jgi:hypothetical protein
VPRKSKIPLYRLHRASGQAVVHVNGRDIYLGVHEIPESKAKYHEIIRKLLADKTKAEMERGALLYVDIMVAELAAKYLPYAESYYTKDGVTTSQTAVIKLATNLLLAKFSQLEARKFGPLGLRACQEEFVAQGLARSEVNHRIRLTVLPVIDARSTGLATSPRSSGGVRTDSDILPRPEFGERWVSMPQEPCWATRTSTRQRSMPNVTTS